MAADHSLGVYYDRMTQAASPSIEGTTTNTLLSAVFCEATEQVIFVRALLEDPRHQTRRQGSSVAQLLRGGLRSVEDQLQAVRPEVFGRVDEDQAARALAGIGMAAGGLRQVHARLGYLGARWPLGTVDLFARKLLAEGMPVPIPTLCPTDHLVEADGEVGADLRARLGAIGLAAERPHGGGPVLTLSTMSLLDPLTWPTLLVPLAEVMVSAQGLAAQLHRPSSIDAQHDGYYRACVAGVAARLVGEATYAACAAHSLLARASGAAGTRDLDLLASAAADYALPLSQEEPVTLAAFYADLLATQARLRASWGRAERHAEVAATGTAPELGEFARVGIPSPVLPSPETIEALYQHLLDGRPINAAPPMLPDDFSALLSGGTDPERFYELLPHADERPCSLATILAVGWRYKVRHSYALCATLMSGDRPWAAALDILTAHVLERCALLQQSMEASYVQQVFSRWRDR